VRTVSRQLALAVAVALAAALALAPAASAHARLVGTSPVSGSTLASQPTEVIFKYNQAVGGTLGAVRVYDAQGNEVDNLDVSHPGGEQHWMGVGLKPHLPDGTYTATYRVISADTHIVYGGLVFNIGHASASAKFTVAGLIARNETGHLTNVAFGVVRALDYISIALMLGGLAFMLVAWLPSLAELAGPEAEWQAASTEFARRMERLLILAIVLGLLVSLLGILLQGASEAGTSIWAALNGTVIKDTVDSRFGEVWGLRALDWIVLGGLLALAKTLRRGPVPALRPVTLGADGTALSRPPPRWLLAVALVGGTYLAATPALGGHASVQSPVALFLPADFIHVLAASVWVGGIACLLLVLPGATRQLRGSLRTRLLLSTLARFSPLALASVIAIAITGVIQAYIDVRSIEGLLHTTYGLLVLVKVALLIALIGLGWSNRNSLIPLLRRVADRDGAPAGAGLLARRTLRGELALMLTVFGVTAALVSYPPPIDAASGPFSTNTTLGPAELEMTVEPARVGPNTIHLYLINAKDGTQYTATKELTVSAELPAKHIGPLALRANVAGPGHYILNAAVLSPGGAWEIQITDRVSEFEEFTRTVDVPIR
jgi:copper transport protein